MDYVCQIVGKEVQLSKILRSRTSYNYVFADLLLKGYGLLKEIITSKKYLH